jgi:hypothetical protein
MRSLMSLRVLSWPDSTENSRGTLGKSFSCDSDLIGNFWRDVVECNLVMRADLPKQKARLDTSADSNCGLFLEGGCPTAAQS